MSCKTIFFFQLMIILLHQITLYVLEVIFLERTEKLIMTIDDKIKDQILQYNINWEAGKILASSGKIDKHEYLKGQETLTSNQSQIIKQAKCTYSPIGKAFEKQTKKQISRCFKDFKPF